MTTDTKPEVDVPALISQMAEMAAELERLKAAQQSSGSRPLHYNGPQNTQHKVYVREGMSPPKFPEGAQVRIAEGTEKHKAYKTSGKQNIVGTVQKVKQISKAREWKYVVQFPGVGRDGICESDLTLSN